MDEHEEFLDEESFDAIDPSTVDASVIWAAEPTWSNALYVARNMLRSSPALLWTYIACAFVGPALGIFNRLMPIPSLSLPWNLPYVSKLLPSAQVVEISVVNAATLAVLLLTVEVVHQGVEYRAGAVLSRALRRLLWLLATNWVAGFVVFVPMFMTIALLVVVAMFLLGIHSPIVFGALATACFLFIYLRCWSRLTLAGARAVLDDDGPVSAVGWSWDNTRYLRPVLIPLVIVQLLSTLLVAAPGIAYAVSSHRFGFSIEDGSIWQFAAFSVCAIIVEYVKSFVEISFCWIYLERRAGRILDFLLLH